MILEVVKAAHTYRAKTGNDPDTLYVGREEWDRLRREASEHFASPVNMAHEGDGRLECSGFAVFVVNADSHFNVCAVGNKGCRIIRSKTWDSTTTQGKIAGTARSIRQKDAPAWTGACSSRRHHGTSS